MTEIDWTLNGPKDRRLDTQKVVTTRESARNQFTLDPTVVQAVESARTSMTTSDAEQYNAQHRFSASTSRRTPTIDKPVETLGELVTTIQSKDPHIRARDLPGLRDALRRDIEHTIKLYEEWLVDFRRGKIKQFDVDEQARQVVIGITSLKTQDHQLSMAELYWVTEGMTKLATAAASNLPDDLDLTDPLTWPSDSGLIYFERGLGFGGVADRSSDNPTIESANYKGSMPLYVYGIMWHRTNDGVLFNMAYSRDDEWEHGNNGYPHPVRWSPLQLTTLTVDKPFRFTRPDQFIPDVDKINNAMKLLKESGSSYAAAPDDIANAELFRRVVAAAMLMQQEGLTSVTKSHGRGGRDRNGAKRRPLVGVTIIDLRHLKSVSEAEIEHNYATLSVRFIVRGHWRNQAHGKGMTLRRPVYVHSYIKGPDGAPLLVRDIVNVWRR